MEEILKASGAEILPYEKRNPYPLGSVSHEAGGARMGDAGRFSRAKARIAITSVRLRMFARNVSVLSEARFSE
jgi:hypothetical protein